MVSQWHTCLCLPRPECFRGSFFDIKLGKEGAGRAQQAALSSSHACAREICVHLLATFYVVAKIQPHSASQAGSSQVKARHVSRGKSSQVQPFWKKIFFPESGAVRPIG